jgi:hypothetical protein
MSMETVHVAYLRGPALDWVMAKVEGLQASVAAPHYGASWRVFCGIGLTKAPYRPSTDWAHGGPLIEREQIDLKWDGVDGVALWWKAEHQDIAQFQLGATPLIAGCRAIAAAKLGESVEVPVELSEWARASDGAIV